MLKKAIDLTSSFTNESDTQNHEVICTGYPRSCSLAEYCTDERFIIDISVTGGGMNGSGCGQGRRCGGRTLRSERP